MLRFSDHPAAALTEVEPTILVVQAAENVIRRREVIGCEVFRMVHGAVCLERKLFIPEATVDDVALACRKALKEMGLKVAKEEKTREGSTTELGVEGALLPLILRTLLYPFSVQQYIKAAQRSGIHVVVSPSEGGVTLYSCGLALDELTGKPAEYISDDDVEEMTGAMEALDFENKFLKRIKETFPKTREME